MSGILKIAADEIRYWRRSKLALLAGTLIVVLALVSVTRSALHMVAEREARENEQAQAQQAFMDQPARHPHRMVHYGHYVFRTPPPLAVIDPGIDELTGRSIFLEGHRQNTATFAAARETAILARFGDLSPAFVVQSLVPLLLILVGFASVVRERETATLVQLRVHGMRAVHLLAGKGLALAGAAGIVLVPVALAASWTVVRGPEGVLPAVTLVVGFALYLVCVCLGVLAVSALVRQRSAALTALLSVWVFVVVIVPRVASETAGVLIEVPSRTEVDLSSSDDLRAAGDGHSSGDPAFAEFQRNLLAEYGVDRVENLPFNFNGLLSLEAERDSTEIQNCAATQRMLAEEQQSRIARAFAVLSPSMALRRVSMASAGTDLAGFHRFLAAAEAQRYEFVQALNRLHAEELTYADDNNRGDDRAAEQRTRVSADSWRLLREFTFGPAPPDERARAALPALAVLVAWAALLGFILWGAARRLEQCD